MGYSIELYFDLQFEDKIRRLWNDLAESGVPSILHQIGSRPHLSLAVLENIPEVQVSNLLGKFIQKYSEFSIEFPAIALIPGEQKTVFLAPTTNLILLEMQQTLYHLLKKSSFFPLERYEPNKWLPHCSISKELSSSDALKTVNISQNSTVTGKTKVIELGIIEFRPRKEIKSFGLNSQ